MHPKFGLFAGSLVLALAAGSAAPIANTAVAACSASDVIDGVTATDTTKAIEGTSYAQADISETACDNAQHAHAILTGNRVNLVWNGHGQIFAVSYSPFVGQFWL